MPAATRQINVLLQSELERQGLDEVVAVEAARWLDAAGLLEDSPHRPGLPLRHLLRLKVIEGAEQRPPSFHGRWFITRTSLATKPLRVDPSLGRAQTSRLGRGEGHRHVAADEVEAALHDLDRSPLRMRSRDWPGDLVGLDHPGLYAWWVDPEGAGMLRAGLGQDVMPGRIYAGQAGATRWPSGKQVKATLRGRIRGNHLRGTIRASTFRHTLAAALVAPLTLTLSGPNRLTPDSEVRLSRWLHDHLELAIHVFRDADALADLEEEVLARLDPPLNLRGMPLTPLRSALSGLRARLTAGHSDEDVLLVNVDG